MKDKLELIQHELQSPDDEDFVSLFRECYKAHDYETGNRSVGTFDCGSSRVDDTPKALYRLLYLLEPNQVSFSNMYKSATLIDVCSPDYSLRISVQFFKYELGLYFGCAQELIRGGESCIRLSQPGADNGQFCSSETGVLWFETFVMCLNSKLSVYAGNDFEV